ncbi:hypothetical protein INR49_013576 [Caranx melampygus]|nr:hypothetical protein INR49_013576 [Caranx melampygus]
MDLGNCREDAGGERCSQGTVPPAQAPGSSSSSLTSALTASSLAKPRKELSGGLWVGILQLPSPPEPLCSCSFSTQQKTVTGVVVVLCIISMGS